MPAPLSIVIPTRNAAGALPALLADLVAGLDAGLIAEVIVADAGSVDATGAIAEAAGARVVTAPAGRGRQLRTAIATARGRWLLILHADSRLPGAWADTVAAHLSSETAATFRLRFDAPGVMPRITAGWANLRTRLFGLPYGDQGLLIARSLYDQIGGYADVELMEDVLIALRLRRRLTLLPATITTGADRYQRNGWVRQGARNLGTLALFFLGRDPAALARRYDRS